MSGGMAMSEAKGMLKILRVAASFRRSDTPWRAAEKTLLTHGHSLF